MPKEVIRDKDGKPFSKWKPADKYAYYLQYSIYHRNCVREYEFDPDRKWRLDFGWPTVKLGVEIDGFGFGHQAQQCMAQDNEKQNAATLAGWKVLRFNSRQLGSHKACKDAVELTEMLICNVQPLEAKT